MITTDDSSESKTENEPQPKRGLDLSPTQVIAGGGAAAVASVIGGHLGLGGTVIGAFILSVITAVAVPLFRTSLEKSHEHLMRVVPRRSPETARNTQQQLATATATATASISRATSGKVSAVPMPADRADTPVATKPRKPLPSRARMAIGAAIIFVIGLGSVVGVQAATGTTLSKGTATLQTGISQVASNGANTPNIPATEPQPSTKAVAPSITPTDGATSPAPESTAIATATSKASPKQTTPAGKATAQPTQAVPTPGPSSAARGPGGQADPGTTVATTAPAAR
ncbi:hypothetical protein NG819_14730 [Pseudarthrobacter sp. Fe7]|nr:hypothetical protein NG819_14730 [Pseudarthrobacter sp. Fe7]